MPLDTVAAEDLVWHKGVAYPRGVRFREIVITGPPGSGKSTLVQKLGGWPEEGVVDLASDDWWRARTLTFRPREVHFAVPFRGFRESRPVTDRTWLATPAPIDFRRIRIPPARSRIFQFDWRLRYIYDFQLPASEQLYAARKSRAVRDSHLVDRSLSIEDVEQQFAVYEQLAMHFHRCGMRVIVRTEFSGMPRIIAAEYAG